MSEAMKRLAEEFLDLSAKVNQDAKSGNDVDLEDYFSLQQMGETLAEAISDAPLTTKAG